MSLNIWAFVAANSTISSSLMFSTTRRTTALRCRKSKQLHGAHLAKLQRCGGSSAHEPRSALALSRHRECGFLDELAHEVKFDPAMQRGSPLQFPCVDLHQLLKHLHLAINVHRLDQGLIAVTQIHAAPDRGLGDDRIGPSAVGQTNRGKGAVFGWKGFATW